MRSCYIIHLIPTRLFSSSFPNIPFPSPLLSLFSTSILFSLLHTLYIPTTLTLNLHSTHPSTLYQPSALPVSVSRPEVEVGVGARDSIFLEGGGRGEERGSGYKFGWVGYSVYALLYLLAFCVRWSGEVLAQVRVVGVLGLLWWIPVPCKEIGEGEGEGWATATGTATATSTEFRS